MQKVAIVGMATSLSLAAAWPIQAQPSPAVTAAARAAASGERQQRYLITTMEKVLEGAVEHGASITRERLQAVLPADMLLSESARARGFRLEGYGVFFDVAVPSLEGTLEWMLPQLRRQQAGVDDALKTLQSFLEAQRPAANVQQAFQQLATQLTPMGVLPGALPVAGGPGGPGSPGGPGMPGATAGNVRRPVAAQQTMPEPQTDVDHIMDNPQDAYRSEVRDALMDVMLDHSRSLNLGSEEWLTVAARSNEARPMVPLDSQVQTVIIRVRGADLNAYLGGQISREDARKRMDVRVF